MHSYFRKLTAAIITAAIFAVAGCGYSVRDAARDARSGNHQKRRRAVEYLSNFIAERIRSQRDFRDRLQAIKILGELGGKRAVNTLRLVLMHETDSSLRRGAIVSLRKLGATEALREIRDALRGDSDLDVRMAAAAALGRLGDESAFRDLVRALKDPQPAVRAAAVKSLVQLHPRRALPLLADALSDNHPDVLKAASDALVKFQAAAVPLLIRELRLNDLRKKRAIQVLKRIGRPAWPYLFRALADSRYREGAIQALEEITGDRSSWRLLAKLIDRPEDQTGYGYLKELEKTATYQVVPALAELWDRLSAGYRLQLRRTMGVIAKNSSPQGCRELEKIVNNSQSLSLKVTALFGIGYCGDEYYSTIKRYLKSRKKALIIAAIFALSRLKEKGFADLSHLSLKLDYDEELRAKAIEALGELDNPKAVDVLIQLLKDDSAIIRISALNALSKQEDRRAIPHVQKLLNDPLNDVVLAAVHTLLKLGDRQNIKLYITAIEQTPFPPNPEYIKTLVDIGDQDIVPILKKIVIEYLKHWKDYVKQAYKTYRNYLRIGLKENGAREKTKRQLANHVAAQPDAVCSLIESLRGLIKYDQQAMSLLVRWGYRPNRKFDPLKTPPRKCPWSSVR